MKKLIFALTVSTILTGAAYLFFNNVVFATPVYEFVNQEIQTNYIHLNQLGLTNNSSAKYMLTLTMLHQYSNAIKKKRITVDITNTNGVYSIGPITPFDEWGKMANDSVIHKFSWYLATINNTPLVVINATFINHYEFALQIKKMN